MTARKNVGGRPKLPEGQALSERVVAHLNRADFATLERWAREREVQVGTVAREILERALARRRRA